MSVTRSERHGGRRRSSATDSTTTARFGGGTALPLSQPDLGYMLALALLISTGMVMVYSTTAIDGPAKALFKIGLWLALGVPVALIAARLPMPFWRKITPIALIACYGLLISLEIPGNPLALNVKGATRWLNLGPVQMQPSELAKLAFVLFAAGFLERRGERMTGNNWMAFLGVLGTMCAIIYKEPDLGTALVLAGTAFCMLIAAGARWRTLAAMAVVGAVLIGTMAWRTPHQQDRLRAYWNPFAPEHRQADGYQVVQSWMALARGGLWGVGLGQSQQKVDNRLPENNTDFIFAIVGEELGLVRAVGVLALFGLLTWRGYEVAARAPDRYSSLVASGVTSWIAVQSCLNIAVVTGTVPNTGVPLPFISSGGSSLLALMAASGIVVGISRRRRIPKKAG